MLDVDDRKERSDVNNTQNTRTHLQAFKAKSRLHVLQVQSQSRVPIPYPLRMGLQDMKLSGCFPRGGLVLLVLRVRFETSQAYHTPRSETALLRGGIVIRTHDVPKNPYIPLLLDTILGPDYYLPSVSYTHLTLPTICSV